MLPDPPSLQTSLTHEAAAAHPSLSPGRLEAAWRGCPGWRWRLLEEVSIVRQIWPRLLIDALVLLYLTPVLFLNLAFYRFIVQDRLPDLGFYYLPELSRDFRRIVDFPMLLANIALAFVVVASICRGRGEMMPVEVEDRNEIAAPKGARKKVYVANMVDTFCSTFAVGHVLRAITYLSTSSPGVSRLCLSSVDVDKGRPRFPEVFYKPASFTENCGDLMFSGHLLQMILALLVIRKYAPQLWELSRAAWIAWSACGVALVFLEAVLIIMARHHYTADVVVALYVTPLLWYSYHLYVKDALPNWRNIADNILRDGQDGP